MTITELVNEILNDTSVRILARDTIREGMRRDPCDADRDAELAADVLAAVANDAVGTPELNASWINDLLKQEKTR